MILPVTFIFLSTCLWSLLCFFVYLALECDGGVVARWMVGVILIASYPIILRILRMDRYELRSFLIGCVGIILTLLISYLCLFYAAGGTIDNIIGWFR